MCIINIISSDPAFLKREWILVASLGEETRERARAHAHTHTHTHKHTHIHTHRAGNHFIPNPKMMFSYWYFQSLWNVYNDMLG